MDGDAKAGAEWRPIPGLPGYEFAMPGRVRSLICGGKPRPMPLELRLSSPPNPRFSLSRGRRQITMSTRQLLALVFGRCPHCGQSLRGAARAEAEGVASLEAIGRVPPGTLAAYEARKDPECSP
jgi:hypothetical protein